MPRNLFTRLGPAALILLIVAIWATHNDVWRTLSGGFGIGNPDAVVEAPTLPSFEGKPTDLQAIIDQSINAIRESMGRPTNPPTAAQPLGDEEAWALALAAADNIQVAPKGSLDGYDRQKVFGTWTQKDGCNTRNRILARDMTSVTYRDSVSCLVEGGILEDPYTGQTLTFTSENPQAVQIDHIVPLANAWRSGANKWSREDRVLFANDAANLLAVEGAANSAKRDFPPSEWMPPNEAFTCEYVSRFVTIKDDWNLSMTPEEKTFTTNTLTECVQGAR